MPRLREQIEGLDGLQRITVLKEVLQIAHLRGRIARHIDDRARAEREKLLEKVLVAAAARRINDDGGVRRREIEAGKNSGGIGGEKRGVGDAVGGGVGAGEADGRLAEFDAGHTLEARSPS